MKTIKLFGAFILSLFTVCLISCNKDDDGSDSDPTVPTYEATFNVSLGYKYKVTDTNSNQVLVDVDYGIADMNMLAYVIHRESDGHYIKMGRIGLSTLQNITTDNIASVKELLPEGKYYITFVAFKDLQIVQGSSDFLTFFKFFTQNYEDAIMQVPNDYIHYATAKIEISATDGTNNQTLMVLKKMTTDLIFEFDNVDIIPTNNSYSLTVGVENIPSAFFIKTGKTLTAKETKEKGLYLYSGSRNIMPLASKDTKALVTTFHTLSNDSLPMSDRGKYWFEFKESANGGKQIKAVSENLDEFSPNHTSSMYIYGLYNEGQLLINKTETTKHKL
nr:hypothetical protein [uncultured Bacteroides sp.]